MKGNITTMEKRKYNRYKINKKIKLFDSDGFIFDKVIDLSRTGCKIFTYEKLKIGDIVILSLGKHYRICNVLWNENNLYGIKFIKK